MPDPSSDDAPLAAWLGAAAAVGAPSYDRLPVAEARRLADAGTVTIAGPAVFVENVTDVRAEGVPARLYEPAGGVLVWFHGGGFLRMNGIATFADDGVSRVARAVDRALGDRTGDARG